MTANRQDGKGGRAASSNCSSADHDNSVPIRVLLVEDMPTEGELTIRHLKQGGLRLEWLRVEERKSFTAALREFRPDIILSDFTLAQFSGLAALNIARELVPEIPLIFVSGTIGEERAIEALHSGAVDYVLTDNLSRLVPAIRRALEEVAARRERRQQEARITRLTRVLRMLSGINAVMLRVRQSAEILEEACRLAVSVGGYSAAIIALKQSGAKPLHTVATGTDRVLTSKLRRLVLGSMDRESSVIAKVLRTGKAYVCCAAAELPDWASTRKSTPSKEVDSRPTVFMPIRLDGTGIGVFVVAAPDSGTVSEEELAMLREVASNLSFALQYLKKNDRVRFLSHFDAQTGLPKRPLFCERVGRKLAQVKRHGARLAVAVIDVEHLSVINDSFGRHMGDVLLQQVADRLRERFQQTQSVAHLGGGTFAVVLEVAANSNDILELLRDHVRAVFGNYFEVAERKIPVTVKSGLAVHPENGRSAESLVGNAEAALRNAKAKGQRALHYSAEAHSEAMAKLALEHKLRVAIEREQFELHYQPKVNVKTRAIEGAEALIRWRSPTGKLVAPAAFLPLLEETGLIVEVGDWMLRRASADCRRWRESGLPGTRIAVNIAPAQLSHPDFVENFFDVAQMSAGPDCGLDIEIVEGMLLEDSGDAVSKLERLRGAGVRIAVDDFGTGYSSLSRLSELPIDTLKIDRCFVDRLPDDHSGHTLVSTIISLARAFDMTVVAEGVETEEQLVALRTMGCDEAQGFLLSAAVTYDEFARLLEHGKGQAIRPGRWRPEHRDDCQRLESSSR